MARHDSKTVQPAHRRAVRFENGSHDLQIDPAGRRTSRCSASTAQSGFSLLPSHLLHPHFREDGGSSSGHGSSESRQFIVRRRRRRKGTWIFTPSLASFNDQALYASYYIRWSSYTPGKASLTLHAGSNAKGRVVGRAWVPRLSHTIRVEVGDDEHKRRRWVCFRPQAPMYSTTSHHHQSDDRSSLKVVMTPERRQFKYPGWNWQVCDAKDEAKGTAFRWTNTQGRWTLFPAASLVQPAAAIPPPLHIGHSASTSTITSPALASTESPLLPTIGISTEEDKAHVNILRVPAPTEHISQLLKTTQSCDTEARATWERVVLLTALAGRFRELRSENRGSLIECVPAVAYP